MSKVKTIRQLYFKKSKDQAPELNICWDLSADNFIKALDGSCEDEFNSSYPNGFAIGKVEVSKIYELLEGSLKIYDSCDLWKTADKSKTLEVIKNWHKGVALTPPLLSISYNNLISIVGGNHRFNVARIYGEGTVIFLVPLEIKDNISCMLDNGIEWIS